MIIIIFLNHIKSQFAHKRGSRWSRWCDTWSYCVFTVRLPSDLGTQQLTKQSFTGLFPWEFCGVFFIRFIFNFFPRPKTSRAGNEYCRVFNPLCLWGLCSIWYQICISQTGCDCFTVTHAHAQTFAFYIPVHWLEQDYCWCLDVSSSLLPLLPAEFQPHESELIIFLVTD